MNNVQIIKVCTDEEGLRLDRWFRLHFPQVKHAQLEKFLRKGHVRIAGGRVKAGRRIKTGEEIRIPPLGVNAVPVVKKHVPVSAVDAQYIRQMVIYQDKDIIALHKPFGLAVQGGEKTFRHIDAMLEALAQGGEKPRLVHRLDRDTGGVLLLGRHRKVAAMMAEAFQKHLIDKEYWALVVGLPRPAQGTIDLPVAKRMHKTSHGEQERMVAAHGADTKKAKTDFQVLETNGGKCSFVALRPRTGRTHQLRVHCAAIGHPIIGDGKYGGMQARLEGISPSLHLFCRAMRLQHPLTRKPLHIVAPLDGHMLASWKFFSLDTNAQVTWPYRDI